MPRWSRVLIELFGPTVLAATIYTLVVSVASGDTIMLRAFPKFLVFAYIFAAIPSIVFTLVMELSFSRGLAVGSWRSVVVAGAVGAVCGVAIGLSFAHGFSNERGVFTVFPALGLTTGCILAFLVGRFPQKSNQAPQHNAGSRPSSSGSPASEIPFSLGPRG